MKRRYLPVLHVRPSPLDPRRGRLFAGHHALPCALGRTGVTRRKREGDGASPWGRLRVLGGFYRADRIPRPPGGLRLKPIRPLDGWCDEPADRRYNRPIRRPDRASHEALWREDGVYDVVLDLAWNRGPIRPGRGSAIFLHLARPGFEATAGCVAVDRATIRRLLARIGPGTVVAIGR